MSGWRTVGVTALAPDVARELAEMDPKVRTQWYWLGGETAVSPPADGSGDLVEFAPIALLRQVRTDDGGENQTRVVPGKLTLTGTVIPVNEQDRTSVKESSYPDDFEERKLWRTEAVAHLPSGLRTTDTGRRPSRLLVCLLFQVSVESASTTRVKLGSYGSEGVVPVSNFMPGFDFGPWKLA